MIIMSVKGDSCGHYLVTEYSINGVGTVFKSAAEHILWGNHLKDL